jgi:hypothetical protein
MLLGYPCSGWSSRSCAASAAAFSAIADTTAAIAAAIVAEFSRVLGTVLAYLANNRLSAAARLARFMPHPP